MASADFYIIKQSTEADRLFFACRLVEKIHNQGRKVYLHTESQQAAEALDDLLWTYRPESFLPHAITGIEGAPIIIGSDESYSGPKDVLINLASAVPAFHSEFQRVAEIVRNDESSKQVSREHWTIYKDKGYELKKVEI